MGLFGGRRERAIDEPDWTEIGDSVGDGERRLGASHGWSIDDGIDHPCGVYLTDRALYVDVRPDTLARRETISIPFWSIGRCGVGRSDTGAPRLVVVFDLEGQRDPVDARGVGVDLPRGRAGRTFGALVTATIGSD